MPYLGKNLVCSIFVQELEFLNLEPKVPYLGVFAAILKNYCHIWNQHVQFPLLQSLVQKKKKILSFGTKNAIFEYLGARIWTYYFNISNWHLRICLIAKFREIIKMPKFGSKTP